VFLTDVLNIFLYLITKFVFSNTFVEQDFSFFTEFLKL